jgi:opacity protein-like surface antigen
MKRVVALAVLAAALAMPAAAAAHVHGVTPLLGLSCHVDNSVTGANRANSTPAAAANGGPITGLIPRDVGNAPLTAGDGGFGATTANC